jgi:hypothetical protein
MSLPVIEMQAKEPEPQLAEKSKEIFTEQKIDEISYGEESSEEELILAEETVEEKEVFLPPKVKEIVKEQKVVEEDELTETELAIEKETGKEIKKGKRAYNRKKPMSEKQLAHLAKIRAIGVEKRKERAKEAREKKLLEAESQAEERLLKKKEKAEDDKILKEAKEAQKDRQEKLKQDRPATAPAQVPLAYSQNDLEKACFNAVESYDTMRKERKKAKQKKIVQDRSEKNKVNMIQNAINPHLNQPPTHDPWRNFFT